MNPNENSLDFNNYHYKRMKSECVEFFQQFRSDRIVDVFNETCKFYEIRITRRDKLERSADPKIDQKIYGEKLLQTLEKYAALGPKNLTILKNIALRLENGALDSILKRYKVNQTICSPLSSDKCNVCKVSLLDPNKTGGTGTSAVNSSVKSNVKPPDIPQVTPPAPISKQAQVHIEISENHLMVVSKRIGRKWTVLARKLDGIREADIVEVSSTPCDISEKAWKILCRWIECRRATQIQLILALQECGREDIVKQLVTA